MKNNNMYRAARLCAGNSGFTLIETMLALMVLVIGIVGVFAMQMVTVKGNASAISLSRAVLESSAVVDKIESIAYSDSALAAGTDIDMTTLFGASDVPSFGEILTYTVADNNNLQALFNLQNETFASSACKVVQVTAARRVNGQNKDTSSLYYKFNAVKRN